MNGQPVSSLPSPLQAACRSRWPRIALGGLALAGCLALSSFAGRQDQAKPAEAKPDEKGKAIVQFANLRYNGKLAAAADLAKVQLVRSQTGDTMWIELFFGTGDYVMEKVQDLVFYRRFEKLQPTRVLVNLVNFDGVGFPFVN